MRFLAVNSVDYLGGSGRRIRKFCEFLRGQEHQVFLLEANYRGKRTPGVASVYQPNNIIGGVIGTLQRAIFSLIHKYDVLLVQKYNPLTAPCIFLAKLRGKKVVVDSDDVDSKIQGTTFRRLIFMFFENHFVKLIDLMLVPNESLYNYFRSLGVRHVSLVPQGIDRIFFQEYNSFSLRKNLSLDGKKVLGFMSFFSPGGIGKLDTIFHAVNELLRWNDSLYFLVIGGGRLLEDYKQLSRRIGMHRVVFTGEIIPEKIPEYLSCADITLICMKDNPGSRMKATMKVMEYLALGKTVVGYVVGETKKMVGEFCVLCEPTIESFVCAAKKILSGKEKRKLARNFLETRHTWSKIEIYFWKALKSRNII